MLATMKAIKISLAVVVAMIVMNIVILMRPMPSSDTDVANNTATVKSIQHAIDGSCHIVFVSNGDVIPIDETNPATCKEYYVGKKITL